MFLDLTVHLLQAAVHRVHSCRPIRIMRLRPKENSTMCFTTACTNSDVNLLKAFRRFYSRNYFGPDA